MSATTNPRTDADPPEPPPEQPTVHVDETEVDGVDGAPGQAKPAWRPNRGQREWFRTEAGRLLAGPIVRHVAADGVSIFVVVQTELPGDAMPIDRVTVEVWPLATGGASPLRATRRVVKIGKYVGACLITVNAAQAPLQAGTPYTYQAWVGNANNERTEPPLLPTRPDASGNCPFGYGPEGLPTFFLPDSLQELSILYGSCRKTNGGGAYDMLAEADAIFVATAANTDDAEASRRRPKVHYLLGDQIYGDDLDEGLLRILTTWVLPSLFGYNDAADALVANFVSKEPGENLARELIGLFPGDPIGMEDPEDEDASLEQVLMHRGWLAPGRRSWISRYGERQRGLSRDQRASFTTNAARNHLLGFAEYAAMYLAVWSPQVLGPLLSRKKPDGQLRWRLGSDASLEDFVRVTWRVRRVLANCATYMVPDDHDVTDDWNLDQSWESRNLYGGRPPSLTGLGISGRANPDVVAEFVRTRPPTLHVISGAVSAFAVFQAWGNTPDRFDQGRPEQALLGYVESAYAGRHAETPKGEPSRERLSTLVKLWHNLHLLGQSRKEAGKSRWHFYLKRSDHEVIGLDTRTWREKGDEGEPLFLLGEDGLHAQVASIEVDEDATNRSRVTFLLCATPWFGLPAHEGVVEAAQAVVGVINTVLELVSRAADGGADALEPLEQRVHGLIRGAPLPEDHKKRLEQALGPSREALEHVLRELKAECQELLSEDMRAYVHAFTDAELPGFNPVGHQQLLAALVQRDARRPRLADAPEGVRPCTPIVMLSGDVHYGTTCLVHYRELRNPYASSIDTLDRREGVILQLTSSSQRNEDVKTHMLRGVDERLVFDDTLQKLVAGWFHGTPVSDGVQPALSLGYAANEKLSLRSESRNVPVEHAPWPNTTGLYQATASVYPKLGLAEMDIGSMRLRGGVDEPDFHFRMDFLRGDVLGPAASEPGAEEPTTDGQRVLAFAVGNIGARHVVGTNNIGTLRFSSDDTSLPIPQAEHTLLGGDLTSGPKGRRWSGIDLSNMGRNLYPLIGDARDGVPPGSWSTTALNDLQETVARISSALTPRPQFKVSMSGGIRIPLPNRLQVALRGAAELENTGSGYKLSFTAGAGFGLMAVETSQGGAAEVGTNQTVTFVQDSPAHLADAVIAYAIEYALAGPQNLVLSSHAGSDFRYVLTRRAVRQYLLPLYYELSNNSAAVRWMADVDRSAAVFRETRLSGNGSGRSLTELAGLAVTGDATASAGGKLAEAGVSITFGGTLGFYNRIGDAAELGLGMKVSAGFGAEATFKKIDLDLGADLSAEATCPMDRVLMNDFAASKFSLEVIPWTRLQMGSGFASRIGQVLGQAGINEIVRTLGTFAFDKLSEQAAAWELVVTQLNAFVPRPLRLWRVKSALSTLRRSYLNSIRDQIEGLQTPGLEPLIEVFSPLAPTYRHGLAIAAQSPPSTPTVYAVWINAYSTGEIVGAANDGLEKLIDWLERVSQLPEPGSSNAPPDPQQLELVEELRRELERAERKLNLMARMELQILRRTPFTEGLVP